MYAVNICDLTEERITMNMKATIYYRGGPYVVYLYPAGLRMLFYHIWQAWQDYGLKPWKIVQITSCPFQTG